MLKVLKLPGNFLLVKCSSLDLANITPYSFHYQNIIFFIVPRDFGESMAMLQKFKAKLNFAALFSFLTSKKHTNSMYCMILMCFLHLTRWIVHRKITLFARPAGKLRTYLCDNTTKLVSLLGGKLCDNIT